MSITVIKRPYEIPVSFLNFKSLHLTFSGKRVNLHRGREAQNFENLGGCRKLRIDNHGDSQLFLDKSYLITVWQQGSLPYNRVAFARLLAIRQQNRFNSSEPVTLSECRQSETSVSNWVLMLALFPTSLIASISFQNFAALRRRINHHNIVVSRTLVCQ